MTTIDKVLPRRSDLSTFLVHLTRSNKRQTAKEVLRTIIEDSRLVAGSPFGHAHSKMTAAGWSIADQKCVCFTEVPLEHICLLAQRIEGRAVEMEPYGIAVTKKHARTKDVNPVWYIDQTIGRTWLSNSLNRIVDTVIKNGKTDHSILKLTPFIEQFGDYKDFHWEREWRCVGDFYLPSRYMVIAPEEEHGEMKKHIEDWLDEPQKVRLIDAMWSLEVTIARLAGFRKDDL